MTVALALLLMQDDLDELLTQLASESMVDRTDAEERIVQLAERWTFEDVCRIGRQSEGVRARIQLRKALGVRVVSLLSMDEAKVWSGDPEARVKCLDEIRWLYQSEEITVRETERVVGLALMQQWNVLPTSETDCPPGFRHLFASQVGHTSAAVRARAVTGLWFLDAAEYADAVVARLKDESVEVVGLAILALRHIAPNQAGRIIPFLLHPESQIRRVAAGALGGMKCVEATMALESLLDDEDELVRGAALDALADLDARGSVREISARLQDPSSYVRMHAVDALDRLDAREFWDDALALLKDEEESVRNQALWLVRNRKRVHALPELVRIAESDAGNREFAAMILHELGGPEITSRFVQWLRREDLREFAIRYLEDRGIEGVRKELETLRGDPAVDRLLLPFVPIEELRTRLRDRDPEVRSECVLELSRRERAEDGAILEKMMKEDPDETVRWIALTALLSLNPPGAARTILSQLPLSDTCRTGIVSMCIGRTGATDCGEELDRLLRSESTLAREAGCRAAGSLRSHAHARAVVALLSDAEADVRISAALALSSLEGFDATALLPLLRDPDPRVVEEVLRTIGLQRPRGAAREVAALLRGPHRRLAIETLQALDARECAEDVRPFLDDSKSGVRIAALRFFAGQEDVVAAMLADPKADVQLAAIRALETRKHAGDLKQFLDHRTFFLAIAAAEALAESCGDESLPWVRTRLRAEKCCRLLGKLGDFDSLDLILEQAESAYLDDCRDGIAGLELLWPRANEEQRKRILPTLRRLEASPQCELRRRATRTLVRLGLKSREELIRLLERECDRDLLHAINAALEPESYRKLTALRVDSLGLRSELSDFLRSEGFTLKADGMPVWKRSPRMKLMDALEEYLDEWCVVLNGREVRLLPREQARRHWLQRLKP